MRFLSNDENFIGAESTLADVRERAEAAADSEIVVFLWGEPGVGKETLARAIAKRSDRGAAPFVNVRLDRLAPGRADALFPTRRENGETTFAFSAELTNEVGSGTLYLAEIDALSVPIQRRLATLLDANDLPFRTILGSSNNFLDARRERRFCPELEAILTQYPIFLPPLRERIADLPRLATMFLRDAARAFGALPRALSENELEIVSKISFKKNLDDLRRYFDIVAQTDVLPVAFGDVETRGDDNNDEKPRLGSEPTPSNSIERAAETSELVESTLPTRENFPSLDAAAKEHMIAALRLTGGVVEGPSGAAALLRINPHTLRARMRKLRLDWSKYRADSENDEDASNE